MTLRARTLAATLFLLWPYTVLGQPVVVDEPSVCFECHSDIEADTSLRHVHTAFEDGKCSSCHNPHAAKHAALLDSETGELCLSCHDGVRDEISEPSPHVPASRGECTLCHDAHASAFPSQLVKKADILCQDCHSSARDWQTRPVVHDPVSDGDCLACHVAHGSGLAGLLNQAVPSLCFECHDADQGFLSAHQGRDISNSDCTACHDPHSGSLQGLLRENQHAPFAGGDCKRCHGSGGADASFAIETDTKALCIECHRGLESFEDATYHGHLTKGDSCLNCHNPHASNASALLAAEEQVLCMRCHFNEPGRKAKQEYVTHEGMLCTECHSPHGADNASYLVTVETDLCAGCHERAHSASHPVGPDVIDERTGESVTCLSCHTMHGSDHEFYLTLDPAMDLCIQCHQR
jgi:predicted CXXCH cytochrome family protein